MIFAIAIDGPSGAGKSSMAKALSKILGCIYVDTGAIYRTVALAVRRAEADPRDAEAVERLLPKIDISIEYNPQLGQRMMLCGEDVSALIRTTEISKYASDVSAIPAVRAFLLELQRGLARKSSVIMDGRDIGTVVLPDAQVKIFLTAAPEERARRRQHENEEKGIPSTYEDILANIIYRDKQDTERAAAPLKPAEDAVRVDTTALSFDESVAALLDVVRAKLGALPAGEGSGE